MEFISAVQLLLYFFYFILVTFITFYIPGSVCINRISLTRFQQVVLATIIGVSLWGLQGFIFGFLHVRFLTYGYLVIFLLLWIYPIVRSKKKVVLPSFTLQFSRSTYILLFIIFVGVFVQTSSVFFTGLPKQGNLYFCCGDNSDFLYFLALSKNLVRSVPPMEPGFVGITVHNYHYLSNLVVADLYRVFGIPLSLLEFQFSFIFLSLFLGLLLLVFSQVLQKNSYFTFWLLFFFYFGGDCIWLLMVLLNSGSHFFSMTGIEDGTKFLMNLPRTFAIDIFLGVLSLFVVWNKKQKNMRLLYLIGILSGTLIGFKVYIGIFALLGLGFVSIYFLFHKKIQPLIMVFIALFVSLILYIPVNSGAGGFYFTGLWIFENFIIQPYLRLDRLELARVIYAEHHNWLRVASYEILYIFITIFALFGTKILGLLQTKQSLKQFPVNLHLLLLPGLLMSFILGFFFQQTSGGANTFNFIVNVFLFGNFYVALTLAYVLYSKRRILISIVLAIIVISLTIPRVFNQTISNLQDIHAGKGFTISSAEIQAYKTLNTYPQGLVIVNPLTITFDKATPYISLFVTQPLFSSGLDIADSHAVLHVKEKQKVIKNIFQSRNPSIIAEELQKNHISYILNKPGKQAFRASESAHFVSTIYKNKAIEILRFSEPDAQIYLKK